MTLTEITKLAKKIRKPGQSWVGALKAAAKSAKPASKKSVKNSGKPATKKPVKKTVKADKMFEKFNHKPATKHTSVDINLKDGIALMGKIVRVDYDSDKQIFKVDQKRGKAPVRTYTHDFEKAANGYLTADGCWLLVDMRDRPANARGIVK